MTQQHAAIAARLKQARIRAGYSRAAECARALGVEQHTYRSWERGQHMPDVNTVGRICGLLCIEPNDLITATKTTDAKKRACARR